MPSSESTANFVTGSSSLKISRKMDIVDIKESIKFFYEKYNSKDYISKGFGWIDNIQQVDRLHLARQIVVLVKLSPSSQFF